MQVATHRQDDTLFVELEGDWALGGTIPRFEAVLDDAAAEADGGAARGLEAVAFDASGLGDWDSSLLTFLVQGLHAAEDRGLTFREDTLPDDIAGLIALSRVVPEREIERDEAPSSIPARLGTWAVEQLEGMRAALTFVGEVGLALGRLVTGRGRMPARAFWVVVQDNSSGALPIVTLIAFLVGLIISFLGAVVLERFGAGYYVSYLVSYGILRELGALMTGIIMAGRTGAAFAAELGSMKITEEIDAYRTLAISPIDYLVVPRLLAIFFMMPLLTIYADFVGIMGGMSVGVVMLDLSVVQFVTGLLEPVVLMDALLGIFKGLVFGLIVGFAGCMRGLQTGDDAGAVGTAATSAVVTGITLIIVANAIIDWAAALLEV